MPVAGKVLRRARENNGVMVWTIAVLCLLLASSPVRSQESLLSPEERAWLESGPAIRFAPAPNYPPVEFFDETGRYKGITADFVALMEKRLGLTFDIVRLKDWAEVLAKSKAREVDLWGAAANTAERREYMNFSRPYIRLPAVIIVRREVEGNLDLSHMAGKKVVAIRGYATHTYLEENFPDLSLITVPDIETGLRMVSFGSADAIVATNASAIYYIEKNGFTNLRVAGESGFEWHLSFAARNDWPKLIGIIQKGLDAITETEKKAIYRSWISLQAPGWQPSRELLIAGGAGIAILVLATMALWVATLRRQVAARLAELRSELQERTKLEEDLRAALEEVRRSNDDLQQYAYVASHDLQEPLRMVTSYLQLLERNYGHVFDDDAKEYIDFAVDGSIRMSQLIKDLLAYSRVTTKGQPLVPLEARSLAESAAGNLRTGIEESGAIITVGELPAILGDETQLTSLFQNLIGNAVKYRAPDRVPEVSVTAEREGALWRFEVRDNGIGIKPDDLERVFVIFQRLHQRHEYEGTGIGLAVCKKIIERHGGHIWVESTPGDGSAFFFTLPATD